MTPANERECRLWAEGCLAGGDVVLSQRDSGRALPHLVAAKHLTAGGVPANWPQLTPQQRALASALAILASRHPMTIVQRIVQAPYTPWE